MVKRFYYRVETTSHARSGGRNQIAEVYKSTRSGMVHVGSVKWNTAGYKGDRSEVLTFLIKKKLVPKKHFPNGYYTWNKAEASGIKIEEL